MPRRKGEPKLRRSFENCIVFPPPLAYRGIVYNKLCNLSLKENARIVLGGRNLLVAFYLHLRIVVG